MAFRRLPLAHRGGSDEHACHRVPWVDPPARRGADTMNPVSDLYRAVTMPFKAVFVVGLCWFISRMTHSGDWWLWVALGMGIATVVALAKGLRTALVLGLVAWVGWKIYQRWGEPARQRFDDWVRTQHPGTARVVEAFGRDGGRRFADPAQGVH
jgi:hypothetical protein